MRQLEQALSAAGLETWVDEHQILPGDDLPGAVSEALMRAGVVIVVISEASVASKWLTYELRIATQRMIEEELTIIPVKLDETSLPPEISTLLWADCRSSLEPGWRTIRASLERSGMLAATAGEAAGASTELSGEDIFGLDDSGKGRLKSILGEYTLDVFRAIRTIEARVGYTGTSANLNLVDALAHLATLAERPELTKEQKDAELSKMEEHLRRAMLDGAEEIVRARASDLATRWEEYREVASTYRTRGDLTMAPPHSELEDLRERIGELLDSARLRKPGEGWSAARTAAAELHQAASLCEELEDRLSQSIAAAEQLNAQRVPVRMMQRLRKLSRP